MIIPETSTSSIQGKIFRNLILATLSALIIFGTALILYDLRDYHERTLEDLATQSKVVGLSVIPALEFGDQKLATQSLAVLDSRPGIQIAAVFDAEGSLFAGFRRNPDALLPADIPGVDGQRIVDDQLLLFRSIRRDGELLGTIFIAGDYQLYERLWQYAGIVFALMLLALAVSMLLSWKMQKQLTRPILGVTSLARQVIEQRNFGLRATKSTNDEVGYLVDAFNDLLTEVEYRSAALRTSNEQLENRVAARTADLERANRELEAFSYSVSHDLRAPLRAIDGFSQALLEDYATAIDDQGQDYLNRVRTAAQRMGRLIDDLLKLAKVSQASIHMERIDLTAMANAILEELKSREPNRRIRIEVEQDISASGDPQLLRIALENLLSNAWKYTGKTDQASIKFGTKTREGSRLYCIEDNGAGFDMAYAGKLFGAFQRLHHNRDFPGTGVGLATVQRIIHRLGGQIWADAIVDKGATFYFTLPSNPSQESTP